MTPTPPLLPTPASLGLPSKFDAWRPGQAEAVLKALDSTKRFVVLGMPTGFGKSLVYLACGALSGEPTIFLTSTKGLQNQLVEDFGESGLVDIRGMGNYPCKEAANELFGRDNRAPACDEGPCLAGWKCPLAEDGCSYFDARRIAAASPLTVTNYSYWMAVNADSGPDKKRPLAERGRLVLDEAHAAIDELGDFLAIEVGHWEVEGVLGRNFPQGTSAVEEWRTWARTLSAECAKRLEQLGSEVRLGVSNNRRGLSRLRELRDLQRRLQGIAAMDGDWVMEEARDRRGRRVVRFDPVWPGAYAESSLFTGVPKVILTSATIRPKTLELLGVPADEYEFLEYPSSFPVALRPFTWVPTVRVRYDMDPGSARLWAAKIDRIIGQRLDRKGIIHTVSYQRRDYLLRYSEYARYMVVHDAAGQIIDAVRKFKEMPAPAILVSPSVGTGFDFPGDECRYIIVGKVPFPSTKSKVLQARQERDKDYFAYVAAQQLVQMVGRGMRSNDDWCEGIIVDDNWSWFYGKYKKFMPRWFTAACKVSKTVPEPLTP
jgi:ATP-dependent DNA helicase DinG